MPLGLPQCLAKAAHCSRDREAKTVVELEVVQKYRGVLPLEGKLPFIPTQPTPGSGLLSFIFQIHSDFKTTVTWVSTIQGGGSQNTPASRESPFVLFHRHHKITTKSYCLLHAERDVVNDGFVFTKAKRSYYF